MCRCRLLCLASILPRLHVGSTGIGFVERDERSPSPLFVTRSLAKLRAVPGLLAPLC